MKASNTTRFGFLLAGLLAFTGEATAQQDVLPPIPKGNIAISLEAVASGLGAPLYGISPPADTSRLFVLEQKGTVLILQNGTLLPTPALDLQSLIGPTFNPGNA